jgi:hypothetical protein
MHPDPDMIAESKKLSRKKRLAEKKDWHLHLAGCTWHILRKKLLN